MTLSADLRFIFEERILLRWHMSVTRTNLLTDRLVASCYIPYAVSQLRRFVHLSFPASVSKSFPWAEHGPLQDRRRTARRSRQYRGAGSRPSRTCSQRMWFRYAAIIDDAVSMKAHL